MKAVELVETFEKYCLVANYAGSKWGKVQNYSSDFFVVPSSAIANIFPRGRGFFIGKSWKTPNLLDFWSMAFLS